MLRWQRCARSLEAAPKANRFPTRSSRIEERSILGMWKGLPTGTSGNVPVLVSRFRGQGAASGATGGVAGANADVEVVMSEQYSARQMKKWLEEVQSMYPKVRIGILEKPVVITAITVTSTVVTEVFNAGSKALRRNI